MLPLQVDLQVHGFLETIHKLEAMFPSCLHSLDNDGFIICCYTGASC